MAPSPNRPAAGPVRPVTVWRIVERRNGWQDPWGLSHDVTDIVEQVELHPTEETHEYSNGYETGRSPVFVTDDGRRFYRYVGIDYHDNVHYRPLDEQPDRGRWVHRLSPAKRWMRDGVPAGPDGVPLAVTALV